MESIMFGLPLSTTIVAFGIPLLITALLIVWGMRFPVGDSKDTQDSEDANS